VIVKICGITCLEDGLKAVECGANALGFNFYPKSPRYVSMDQAAEIIAGIDGSGVLTVAVVVANFGNFGGNFGDIILNSHSVTILSPLAKELSFVSPKFPPKFPKFAAVQIHGIEHPSELPDFGRRLLVAVSAENAPRFPDNEIIVDSSWGTGRVGDWSAIGKLTRPYILSGGLNPDNVARAIETLHPAGVDVCSGVESVPGRKDMRQLKRFVAEVRQAYGEF